jgi:hypothetical protein
MMADSFKLNNDDNRSPSLLDACLLIRGRHQDAGTEVSAMARDKKRLLPSRILRSARAVMQQKEKY